MFSSLIRLALTQRLLMLVLTAVLAGAGFQAFRHLSIDAFPDVSSTQVKIIIKAPGMSPEDIEARITAPIEVEMLGLPHQTMLRSVAKYALTDITIDFADGTDIYWARQQVTERLNGVWEKLPEDISGGIAPMTTPLGEMFMFTVEGDISLQEKRSLLDWVIRPALRTVAGVADVNALGGTVRSFEIMPDRSRMYARGISMAQLQQALEFNNRNDGAGRLDDGEESLLVRAEGRFKTLQDIAETVIRSVNGMPVRIGDIAQVRVGALTRYGAVTANGHRESVQGLVLSLRDANAREVVHGIKAKLDEISASLPEGVTLHTFYDRSSLVDKAVGTVSKALLEAVVLVIALLILFLGNLRAALTVALSLPLAVLITFILMQQSGLSANLMSLGGLSIAIGMLVDAAVVVVENIISHLAHDGPSRLPRLHLIFRAVREVSVPVTAGIIIIVTVFLPLLTLQGLEGKLFSPVALTIVFALSGSLLLSLTVIPVLASFLLGKVSHKEPWLVRQALRLYQPTLQWSLAHSRLVCSLALVLLLVTAFIYSLIGKTFMPQMDEGDVVMQTEKLPSINLESALGIDKVVQQKILAQVPEVTEIVARTGTDELGLDPMGLNQTDSFLVLKPRSQWRSPDKNVLLDALRQTMHEVPGIHYAFTQPIEMRVNEMILGVRGDLAIKIFGDDLDELNRLALQTVDILQDIRGSEDVYTPINAGVQYLRITVDRLAAGRLGLDITQLQDTLRSQLEGRQIGIVQEGPVRTPVLLRGNAALQGSVAEFSNLRITLPDGSNVPVSTVASLERVDGPVKIDRERGNRMVVVVANIRDRDLVGFVDEAKSKVQQHIMLPQGYLMQWGGQFENQQRAAARLGVVVPLAIVLVFLLLFATFRSLRQAGLILCNIPFAMIGGVLALWASGEYLSVPASVGFIALLGIAVLNGVVMMSYFNQLADQGMALSEIVMEGAKRRLRPVLMTASIAAFGLLPLLFASGPGSEIQRPLAIVVIGGLVTSTLLTLILLPILYRRFGFRERN
ncbi:cobalt-zinc-cadmium resistance protein CzcA [Methylobacillus rhizosphaerae]|uniref:Cobalt-zinc-cadmium resistance protein CzcA n=1 Tax=Methylobacillus rhizosphaerae TaxID=551994 RepID=A0A238ZMS7_9PROT|nr:CusA/CzcA family heavy metal efflux RND transporter [Methylobacillus rhizosphaerae]SNR84715.1 cobalt-zinc-cadmium resistance protein CzcA [Methylobacillus rhizosphaerae]